MDAMLSAWAQKESAQHEKQALALKFQREQMVQRQWALRREMDTMQAQRQDTEARERAARVPKGIKGLWGWVSGQTRKIKLQNELDAQRAQERDRTEREAMIQKQLAERRLLHERVKIVRAQQHESMQELTRDVALYARLGRDAPSGAPEGNDKAKEQARNSRKAGRSCDRGKRRNDGPELEL